MKSLFNRYFSITTVILLLSACSFGDDPEIEVRVENNPYSAWGAARIVIQATVDETIINEVVINRGNCATHDYGELDNGKALKYGELFNPTTLCKLAEIREVEVTTEKNTYTFTFE